MRRRTGVRKILYKLLIIRDLATILKLRLLSNTACLCMSGLLSSQTKKGKLLISHRSTIYPCCLPTLGEFDRSWSYKTYPLQKYENFLFDKIFWKNLIKIPGGNASIGDLECYGDVSGNVSTGLFLHFLLETFGQHRDNLVEVTDDAEVSGCEDRCVFVLVDGDDEV